MPQRTRPRFLRHPAVRIAVLSLLLAPLATAPAATAETFTVTLDNGNTLTSRYQPRLSLPDESKVMLLTDTGNWIALPRERVVDVTSNTESRGFGRVIDTTTIALGYGPNEGDPMAEAEAAMDPTSQLLRYLAQRDAAPQRDYSVDQFVDTEQAGQGGFPSSFGGGSFGVGGPGSFVQPGSVVVPPPVAAPAPADGVQ
ncbi:MAG: hypothetical protein OES32_10035 [Acidobacteriota bacterium]|nr:hypothetical protein [Acidobacteriota bacterium]MDH3523912.1 hypothetical protein [Acidobacteriota bacterium]